MTPVVRLDRVSKSLAHGGTGLSEFGLTVHEGECLGLLGPSHSGKSTVLRLIAGLDSADAGDVQVASGARPTASPGSRDVAFLFREPALMPWATVFDNVWLPLRLAGVARKDARGDVGAALAAVGLAGCETASPSRMSADMRARVSIARALVTRPRLLLMDDPFATLDETARFRLGDHLMRLKQSQGWTVVFATRSVFEGVYLGTRVVVMTARGGRVAGEVTVDVPCPRGAAFRADRRYLEACAAAADILRRAAGETA